MKCFSSLPCGTTVHSWHFARGHCYGMKPIPAADSGRSAALRSHRRCRPCATRTVRSADFGDFGDSVLELKAVSLVIARSNNRRVSRRGRRLDTLRKVPRVPQVPVLTGPGMVALGPEVGRAADVRFRTFQSQRRNASTLRLNVKSGRSFSFSTS